MRKITNISFIIIVTFIFFVNCGKINQSYRNAEAEEAKNLWIDTVMSAKGHAFGYSGDITEWGGWYFDTIPVGDDQMLRYDSIAPATLKLSLITRELLVDLGDPEAPEKIIDFMKPIDGFMRFQKSYEETLDSVFDEEYGLFKCTGYFSYTADYADSCIINSDRINRFICELSGVSQSEAAKIPGLSTFGSEPQPTKSSQSVSSSNKYNFERLSDYLANETFDFWKRCGEVDQSSNGGRLEIRTHISNLKFVTVCLYEYDRIGTGHGMYTQTFHTLDLLTGKELKNNDIFKNNSLEKVKTLLYESMANDPQYIVWNPQIKSAADIESRKLDLPQGSLTPYGVVFSFQPYEIDCWAAGAYHFIVPYEKLIPYLRPEAKRLISIYKPE